MTDDIIERAEAALARVWIGPREPYLALEATVAALKAARAEVEHLKKSS